MTRWGCYLLPMLTIVHALLGVLLGGVLAGVLIRMADRDPELSFCLSRKQPLQWWGFHGLVGALTGWVFWMNTEIVGLGAEVVFLHVVSLALIMAALADVLYRLVPAPLLFGLWVVILLAEAFLGYPMAISSGIAGALAVGGVVLALYVVTKGRGIGEADVVLAFILGMLFGWRVGLVVFAVANMLGLVVVLPLIAVLGKERMKQIPLVFFIVLAIFLEWYFGYVSWIFTAIGLTSFP